MGIEQIESKFIATKEKGEVSSLLIRPERAEWLLVLGHGASTNMRHATLQTIAERLRDVGIATYRYQFPYMERGGGGRESQAVALETVRSAVRAARSAASDLPILVGGHSYSGRMSSLATAERPLEEVRCILQESLERSAPNTLSTSRSRCYSYPARETSWQTWHYCHRSAKDLAKRQRCTYWILRTTASKCSNALVNQTKMSSSRWHGLPRTGLKS